MLRRSPAPLAFTHRLAGRFWLVAIKQRRRRIWKSGFGSLKRSGDQWFCRVNPILLLCRDMVTAAEFRSACGLFASGVTVVTRRLPDGSPYGMTVSSFTSVSLDPALILVCIDRNARFLRDLASDQSFAVNILGEEQQHIAARFADRKEDDRFSGVEWSAGWEHFRWFPVWWPLSHAALRKGAERGPFPFDRRGASNSEAQRKPAGVVRPWLPLSAGGWTRQLKRNPRLSVGFASRLRLVLRQPERGWVIASCPSRRRGLRLVGRHRSFVVSGDWREFVGLTTMLSGG